MEDRHLVHFSKTLGATSIPQLDHGSVSSLLYRGFHDCRNKVFGAHILGMDKHGVAGIGKNAEDEGLHDRRKDWSVLGAERDDWPGQFGRRIDDMATETVGCCNVRRDSQRRDTKHAHRNRSGDYSGYIAKEFLPW